MFEKITQWLLRFGNGLVVLSAIAACEPLEPPQQHAPRKGVLDGTVAATRPRAPSFGPDVAAGEQALALGDPRRARRAFELALGKKPNNPRAVLGLADAMLAVGDLDAAKRLYRGVRANNSGIKARLLQGRGMIALREQDAALAAPMLEQSVTLNARLWRAWLGLGQANDQLGRSQAALRAYQNAETNAPARAPVYNDIGMSHLARQRPKEAARYFERALAVEPEFDLARNNLRIARAWMGAYSDAVSGAPAEHLADVLNNVGYVAILRKDFTIADTYLRRAVQVSPIYHEAAVANLDLLARVSAGTAGVGPIATGTLDNPRRAAVAKPASADRELESNLPRPAPAVPPAMIERLNDTAAAEPVVGSTRRSQLKPSERQPFVVAENSDTASSKAADEMKSTIETVDLPPPTRPAPILVPVRKSDAEDGAGGVNARATPSFRWEREGEATTAVSVAGSLSKAPGNEISAPQRKFNWADEPAAALPAVTLGQDVEGRTFNWSN